MCKTASKRDSSNQDEFSNIQEVPDHDAMVGEKSNKPIDFKDKMKQYSKKRKQMRRESRVIPFVLEEKKTEGVNGIHYPLK